MDVFRERELVGVALCFFRVGVHLCEVYRIEGFRALDFRC